MATPLPLSLEEPPRYVSQESELPPAASLATKASWLPPRLVSYAPFVASPLEVVRPVRKTLRAESRATPAPLSVPEPPKKVEKSSAVPAAVNCVMKASCVPPSVLSYAPPVVGKEPDCVEPTTTARPSEVTATALPTSVPVSPKKVLKDSPLPSGLSL